MGKKNQFELLEQNNNNYQLLADYHSYDDDFDNEMIVEDSPFVGYEGEDGDGNLYAAKWLPPHLVLHG